MHCDPVRTPDPIPPELTETPFTVAAAKRSGVSRARLENRVLTRPTYGVRSVTPVTDVVAMASALAAALPTDCVFSHETAARLWGLPCGALWQPHFPSHVMRVSAKAPIRRRGVRAHQGLEVRTATEVGGLSVTSLLDTFVDVAAEGPLETGVVLGDALVMPPWGLLLSTLTEFVESTPRAPSLVHTALSLVRVGSASPQESRTRILLVMAGLPEPALNAPIFDVDGSLVAIGDLVWWEQKVVVEYEGDQHRSDRVQWQRDIARYRRLQDVGWSAIRVSAEDLERRPTQVVAQVRNQLRRRAS